MVVVFGVDFEEVGVMGLFVVILFFIGLGLVGCEGVVKGFY